jgi:hypothetical protein
MQVLSLSMSGVKPASPRIILSKGGYPLWAFNHGELGRNRHMVTFPLGAQDFPTPKRANDEDEDELLQMAIEQGLEPQGPYRMIPLRTGQGAPKLDAKGQQMYLLGLASRETGESLIFLDLNPGWRGSATYKFEGDLRLIAEGTQALGAVGYAGAAPCPVLLSGGGPAIIQWERTGQLLHGGPRWEAAFNGGHWTVSELPDLPQ